MRCQAEHAVAVVLRGDDAGDVRAVEVVLAVVDVSPWRLLDDLAGQIGVAVVDAGIDDRHPNICPGRPQLSHLIGVQIVQRPLGVLRGTGRCTGCRGGYRPRRTVGRHHRRVGPQFANRDCTDFDGTTSLRNARQ